MNIPKEALERMKNSIIEENKLLEEMKALIGDQLEGLKVIFVGIESSFNYFVARRRLYEKKDCRY